MNKSILAYIIELSVIIFFCYGLLKVYKGFPLWATDAVAVIVVVTFPPFEIRSLLTNASFIFFNGHVAVLFFGGISVILCAFARLFKIFGIAEARTGVITDNIFDCLYFAIITWTTVGYGDLYPASRVSRLLGAYAALTGYFTLAAIFAGILTIGNSLSSNWLLEQP